MVAPPQFLKLAGHPLRWRLLTELSRSDLRVGELCERAGERQNLVSYHLRQLRDGGLVTARRSAADGRDSYYVLDLDRCAELLSNVGVALHPALATHETPATATAEVLFLCTGNSARSQLAEALAEQHRIKAYSAGSDPKPIHPHAIRVAAERGLDLTTRRPKHLSTFTGRRFDYVVSLCDRVRERCPELPGAELVHWSIPDPSRDGLEAFERTAAELETRIRFLVRAIDWRHHA